VLHDALTGGRADVGHHRSRRYDGEHACLAGDAPERADGNVSFDDALGVAQVGRDDFDIGCALEAFQHRSRRRLAVERDAHERSTCAIELRRWREGEVFLRRRCSERLARLHLGAERRRGELVEAAAEIPDAVPCLRGGRAHQCCYRARESSCAK
jgi:hypothetical protein